ncbi:hypothetical protein C27AD_02402 [Salinisphaera hydrothermalis C27AD]
MALFRLITAEEEAVAGLFYALKFRQYKNAKQLNPRDHIHKSAATPFLQILAFFFDEWWDKKNTPWMRIMDEGKGAELRTAFETTISGEKKIAHPIPPLNFSVSSNGEYPSFEKQMDKLLGEQSQNDMLEFVQDRANLRNKILYANSDGFPSVSNIGDGVFERCQRVVMAMVYAYLFIQPYPEKQLFVQESLNAFLVMLGRVERDVLAIKS